MPHRIRVVVESYDLNSAPYPSLPVYTDVASDIIAGTASDQADSAVLATYTIAAAGTQSVDLNALVGASGQTVSLQEVHAIVAWGSAGSGFTLTPHATNGWTGLGSAYSITAGDVPVVAYAKSTGGSVASDNKVITLTNVGPASATINLHIIGRD
jgi:hypothetical protein